MATYKVNVGIDFNGQRAEAGDSVTDTELPAKSIKWLLEQEIIELVEANNISTKKGKAPEPVVLDEPENGLDEPEDGE